MRKKWIACCILILQFLILPLSVFAAPSGGQPLDLMFVVDCSGSMRDSDPEQSVRDLIRLFAAAAHPELVRIGIVGYSDKIVAELPPQDISTEEGRQALEGAIYGLEPRGNTDIGLGLSRAKSLLEQNEARTKALILISDGETYVVQRGNGRGVEASNQDAEDVLNWAKSNSTSIYTVTVGAYDGSTALLSRLSSETGGALYPASNPAGFLRLLEDIVTPIMQSPMTRISELKGTGTRQETLLSVPHGEADVLSVIFYSEMPISGLQVERDALADGARFFSGARYSVVMLPKPKTGDYRLQFTAADGLPVSVYTLYGYSGIRCEVSLSSDEKSLATVRLTANRDGKPVEDAGYYESLRAEAVFNDPISGETLKTVLMEQSDGGLTASYEGQIPYSVSAVVTLSGTVFSGEVSDTDEVVSFTKKDFPLIPVILGVTIALLLIIIVVMISGRKKIVPLLQTTKYPYAGKLVGYVMRAADGAEYPPFSFVLSGHYSSNPISLLDILRFSLGDDLDASESDKISFAPGPDHSLIFRHDTSQTIMLGPLITVAGQNYLMDYGVKLYMMLQNGRVEMELHYKAAGPKEFSTYRPGTAAE